MVPEDRLREAIQQLLLGSLVFTFAAFLILFSHGPARDTTIEKHMAPVASMAGSLSENSTLIGEGGECDLSRGKWVWEERGRYYDNVSCPGLPDSKDCFKYGRTDKKFLNWRWKPDGCGIPRFEPEAFLDIVRGKIMLFIGDSVARNHADSLACLLSQEEVPQVTFDDQNERLKTWYFSRSNFTIVVLWSQFLVASEKQPSNNPEIEFFELHIDKVEKSVADKLPGADYAVISSGQWFFRKNYIYRSDELIGCYFCYGENITDLGFNFAYREAWKTVLRFVNNCKECGNLLTILRTYSPSHFENGTWNDGGQCSRTLPLEEQHAEQDVFAHQLRPLRDVQADELQIAKEDGQKTGRRFMLMDVSRAFAYRADGHPGTHFSYHWIKGRSDCVHWCLPGAIDSWNDFLLALLQRDRIAMTQLQDQPRTAVVPVKSGG